MIWKSLARLNKNPSGWYLIWMIGVAHLALFGPPLAAVWVLEPLSGSSDPRITYILLSTAIGQAWVVLGCLHPVVLYPIQLMTLPAVVTGALVWRAAARWGREIRVAWPDWRGRFENPNSRPDPTFLVVECLVITAGAGGYILSRAPIHDVLTQHAADIAILWIPGTILLTFALCSIGSWVFHRIIVGTVFLTTTFIRAGRDPIPPARIHGDRHDPV